MKYFSMFSGVGGFELGIQRAFETSETAEQTDKAVRHNANDTINPIQVRRQSATCIGYSEIDKYAIETYEHNWKGHTNYGDATTINERKLPDFDLLVGGFPCQAFSIAGKRAGFSDTRGTLFFDIARILKHKRPRHLVLENVKGLLSHDSGKTFATILGVLSDLGYRVEWQVLNAKDFGVPQNRERIFFIGHLRGECGRKILPIGRNNGQTLKNIGYLNSETWQKRNESIRRVYDPSGIAPTTPTGTGGGVMTKIAGVINRGQFKETGDNALTITANYHKGHDNHGQRPMVKSAATRTRKYAGKPETLEVRPDNVSNTVNSVNKDYYATDLTRIRRLTPTECERLMSWPDGWTIGSDTQRYKQCGNGVVSNVVQAVIEGLKPCLV